MAPQFVDFNADGHTDIVTATFDGSPWVSLGSEKGFNKPGHILDAEGERIILSQFWHFEEKKWTKSDHTGGKMPDAHCISAAAFDWDDDGDFDLILGDRKGHLYLTVNEGSATEHKFASTSKPIMIGDEMLDAGGKITAPRMVDWDKDGLTDIVVGTFGDSWGTGEGGGIKWFRNNGKKGEPKFETAKTILENSTKDAKEATKPDAGLYVDVVDYDGDGDLDLVVGGYSLWTDEKASETRNNRPNRKPYVWVYLQKDKAEEKPVER